MFGLRLIRIIGPSMEPTLRNGQIWCASRGRVRPGQLIVFMEPGRPSLLTVKRAASRNPDGWWVAGDNQDMSRDSRDYGPILDSEILAILRFRVR
jgi:signal peptidase I